MTRARTFSLPWPPSVNHQYGRRSGRVYLTKAAKDFRANVLAEILSRPLVAPFVGPVSVRILAQPPRLVRTRDIDNVLKATLDALQAGKVFKNDSQITYLSIRVYPGDSDDGRLLVEIEPCLQSSAPCAF